MQLKSFQENSFQETDVIVIGAGPGGASAAYFLREAGLDVIVLEKDTFPREKVCGDGLTPRAVKTLQDMQVDLSRENGFLQNEGLRIIGGGMKLELPWPELTSYPSFGLVRTRIGLDEILIKRAVLKGAKLLENEKVEKALWKDGKVVGVETKSKKKFYAKIVVAADGASTRFSLEIDAEKKSHPMGVAIRAYYKSPRHEDSMLESWLELRSEKGDLLPGYGWVFGVGDGTSNVGLGILNTTKAWQNTNYKKLFSSWVSSMPKEWQFQEYFILDKLRSGALPMGFSKEPVQKGILFVGDSAGMVNPFNGEGIAYALESGRVAAEVASEFLKGKKPLADYSQLLKDAYGGYYSLGRVFVELIGNPHIMQIATKHGLPRPLLMKFTLKLLANLTDDKKDIPDRLINTLSKLAPSA